MGKFLSALVLALVCGMAAGAAPRQAGVRVGPDAEERKSDSQPGGTRKEEGAAGEGREAKPPAEKADKTAKPDASDGAARKTPERGTNGSQTQTPASVSSAVPPVTNGSANATSDAPAKPGPAVGVPVSNPTKVSDPPASAPAPKPAAPAVNTNGALGNPSSQPAANALPPPPPLTSLYRIGVGDVLDIRLLNQPDSRQSTLYTVLAGGLIEYPLIRGHVPVSGMTPEELAAQLVAELRHRGVFERPQVRVSVREYASHAVLVSGLVSDPGTKILRREAVPLYVIVAESQPKPEAGRAIVTSLATGKTSSVDLLDAAGMNLLVQQGDVVNLVARPPEFFYVGGEIASPGQKSFHHGMTLTQGVLASGGVTAQAGAKVKVLRQGPDGRLVATEYNLKEIEGGVAPDPALQAGDRVEVLRASGRK